MVLKLTRRWQPLRFHPEQSRAWSHPARFKTIHAGRRSGKTEIFGKRKRVLWLWDCLVNRRPWPDPRSFIAAPTRDQVKKIYWQDVKALTPPHWIKSISETDLSIITRWGAELHLIGLDKPSRIEGPGWDGGAIDELADCKPGLFDANVRPAIADRLGTVDLLGVPDMHGPSQVEYEKMCERGQTGLDTEWADFCWGSKDILPAEEIASMSRTMDPRVFAQETTGKFVLASGRAFPDFDLKTHGGRPVPYDPALPICWSLDFNVNPFCTGVIQHHMGEVRVIEEIDIPDTHTGVMCEAFLDRAAKRGWNLKGMAVYGDASGDARKTSASGWTDWTIVQNHLRGIKDLRWRVPSGNPSLKDTINAVNAKIKSAEGKVNLRVDPSCTGLLEDLRAALWPSDLKEQHRLAWLRYFVEREYPVLIQVSASPGRVIVMQ